MKKTKIKKRHLAYPFLVQYWSEHCTLKAWHEYWILKHVQVLTLLKKHDELYLTGAKDKSVYLVFRGALGVVKPNKQGRNRISHIALPGMALMTRMDLDNGKPLSCHIVVLAAKSIILEIPFKAITAFKKQEPSIATLAQVIGQKEKEQLARLRLLDSEGRGYPAYCYFMEHLPELRGILTNQEVADLLGVSISTIERYSKKWLKGGDWTVC